MLFRSKDSIQKVVAVVMFSAGAVYGISYYYTLKQASLIGEWKTETQTHRRSIAEVAEMKATAERQADHRAAVTAFVAKQRGGMVSSDPFAWVVREITLLVENYPVVVDGIRSVGDGQCRYKNSYETFSAGLTVSGTYDEIGQFVAGLENRFSSATVNSLQVTAQDGDRHQAVLQFTLLVTPAEKSVRSAAAPTEKKPS